MKCDGVGKAPRLIYKQPTQRRLYYNEPNKYDLGHGECAKCSGCYAVRRKGDRHVMGYHHALHTVTIASRRMNDRRKIYWQNYRAMNRVNGVEAPAGMAPTINQRISVVETTGVGYVSGAGYQVWQSNTPFRFEITSSTSIGGNYYFDFNNTYHTYPTATVTVATNQVIWADWSQSLAISQNATIQMGVTWNQWTNALQNVQVQAQQMNQALRRDQRFYAAPREDPISYQERRQREAEALFRRVEAQNQAKAEAQAKAERTLLELLTPEQRTEYRQRKMFHVRGSKGTLYRILHGSSGNVRQVLTEADEGRGLHGFCAHPRMHVALDEDLGGSGVLPHEDAMIAQMLALITDEDSFLAVANRHW